MAGRSSASGESKAQLQDRMQMLGSFSYARLVLQLSPPCASDLLNHRKADRPFQNIGPGMPIFFWSEVGLYVPALEVSLHTRKKKEKKSSQHKNLKAASPHGGQRNYPHREITPSTAAPSLGVVTQFGRGRASSFELIATAADKDFGVGNCGQWLLLDALAVQPGTPNH